MFLKVNRKPLTSSVMTNVLTTLTLGSSSLSRPRPDTQRGERAFDRDPDDRHGDEHLPPETHDLIVAVARESAAKPQEAEAEERHLRREPAEARRREERVVEPGDSGERRQPAAE